MKPTTLKSLMVALGVLLSLHAHAYDAYVDGIYYNLATSTKTATVTSGGNKYIGNVDIPSSFNYNGSNYSVTSIGAWAFSSCSGLTSITIPNSVTSIDGGAFYNCSGLTSITIPNSVTSIGYNAFYGTGWYNNQEDGVVYAGLVAYQYKGTMPDNTEIVLKDGTKSISDQAFWGRSGLTSINIPNSVTSIGSYAFYGCSGLTSITIPNSVTSIGSSAFSGTGWYNNQEDGVVYAGLVAYQYKGTMPDNTEIVLKDGTKSISGYAFWGRSGLTSITIPNSVTSIGIYAFSDCSGLTSITIPNSVTSIGSSAFNGCSGLTSITIPNSVTSIGSSTFCDCSNLTSITIPNSVTSIGSSAFNGCSGLTSITIPNSVTSIDNDAFYGCSGLTSITIPNSVTSIGYTAFYGTGWYNNQEDGVVYAGLVAYQYKGTMPDNTEIVLKDGTKSIGYNAFYGCSGLTTVTIPNSVTSISGYAFYGCSGLTSITIPNSVTSISYMAFSRCSGLTSVISEIKEPFAFGSSAFSSISSDCVLTVPCGTKDAYIAAGWTEDVFKGGIVEAEPVTEPSTNNTLAVTDTQVLRGRQIVLPVNMSNTEDITAIQFDLTLPTGVSIAKNTKGKYIVEKTERCADHTLSASKPGEANMYKVLLYSTEVESITGNEGAVINVTLEATEGMEAGDYEVRISNINLTTTAEKKITPADATCVLTVRNSIPGDANGDSSIDVTDIVAIANSILGHASESFDTVAADVNGDGSVDVTDIVVVANIILHDGGANAVKVREAMQMLDPQ